ncbi:hypothetical protein DER45DRAFT_229773 [Fusarium avenaceum]|nr:hypothetical protein DER45DRAFT_229773 [Fusarium avenaceum]
MAGVLLFLHGAFSFVTGGNTTGSEVSWELRHFGLGSARDCPSSLTTKAAWKHSTQPFHLTTDTLVTLFTSSDNNDTWNQSTRLTPVPLWRYPPNPVTSTNTVDLCGISQIYPCGLYLG